MFAVTLSNSTEFVTQGTPHISYPARPQSAYLKRVLDDLHENRRPISWREFARLEAKRLRGDAARRPILIRKVA